MARRVAAGVVRCMGACPLVCVDEILSRVRFITFVRARGCLSPGLFWLICLLVGQSRGVFYMHCSAFSGQRGSMFQPVWFLLTVLCTRCSKADGLLRVSMGSAFRAPRHFHLLLSTMLPLAVARWLCIEAGGALCPFPLALWDERLCRASGEGLELCFFRFCLFVSTDCMSVWFAHL